MFRHRREFTREQNCLETGAKMCTLSDAHSCRKLFQDGTKHGRFEPSWEELDTDIDLPQKFEIIGKIGGGKSGAYILIVKDKQQEGETSPLFLKLYADAVDQDGSVLNERPYREIYTYCMLNGRPGFACTACFGASPWPGKWEKTPKTPKEARASSWEPGSEEGWVFDARFLPERRPEKVLWILMQRAPGVTLMDLPIDKLSESDPWSLFGAALEIVAVWQTMQDRMGKKDFTHWDYHPENIFIDQSESRRDSFEMDIGGIEGMLSFPKVTVIDFDLVTSDIFPTLLPEHENKKNSPLGITERAIQWVMKWAPPNLMMQWFAFLISMRKVVHLSLNEDMWHILTYIWILSSYAYSGITGQTVDEVLDAILGKLRNGSVQSKLGNPASLFELFYDLPTSFVEPQKTRGLPPQLTATGKLPQMLPPGVRKEPILRAVGKLAESGSSLYTVAFMTFSEMFMAGLKNLDLLNTDDLHKEGDDGKVETDALASPAMFLLDKATKFASQFSKPEEGEELEYNDDPLNGPIVVEEDARLEIIERFGNAVSSNALLFREETGHYPMFDNIAMRASFNTSIPPLNTVFRYIAADVWLTEANAPLAQLFLETPREFELFLATDKLTPLVFGRPRLTIHAAINLTSLKSIWSTRGQTALDKSKVNIGLTDTLPDRVISLTLDEFEFSMDKRTLIVKASSEAFVEEQWSVVGTVMNVMTLGRSVKDLVNFSSVVIVKGIVRILSGLLYTFGLGNTLFGLWKNTVLIENDNGQIRAQLHLPEDEIAPNSLFTCVGAATKALSGDVYLPYVLDCLSVVKSFLDAPVDPDMEELVRQSKSVLRVINPISLGLVFHTELKENGRKVRKVIGTPVEIFHLDPVATVEKDEEGRPYETFTLKAKTEAEETQGILKR